MAQSQIPDEIWLHIVDFLGENSNYLRKVWWLNSLFLHRYLDAKYHAVDFFPAGLDPSRFSAYLGHISSTSQPYISGRIHRLNISVPRVTYRDIINKMADTFSRIAFDGARFTKTSYLRLKGMDNEGIGAIASRLLFHLPHLDSLSVCDDGMVLPKAFFSVAQLVWSHQTRILGPEDMTLRHLRLDMIPQNLKATFLVSSPTTPACMRRLQSLSMSFRSTTDGSMVDAVRTFFRALVTPSVKNATPPSLRSLSLHFYDGQVQEELFQPIFTILGPDSLNSTYKEILRTGDFDLPRDLVTPNPLFPELTHFSLFVSKQLTGYIIHALKFLAIQGNTITHIRLPAHRVSHQSWIIQLNPRPGEWTFQLPPSLPKLEYVEMNGLGQYSLAGLRAIIAYFVLSEPVNIKTLRLDDRDYPLSYREIDDFCRHFKNSPATDRLKIAYTAALSRIEHLTLHLLTLTPNHLYLLSSTIPNIRSLEIRVFSTGAQGGDPETNQFPLRGNCLIGAIPEEPYLARTFPKPATIDSLNTHYLLQSLADGITIEESFFTDLVRFASDGRFTGWTQQSRLEEIKIFLEGVGEAAEKRLEDGLREIFSGVKHIEVGSSVGIKGSLFDDV